MLHPPDVIDKIGASEIVSVSTSVLRALGASSWTGLQAVSNQRQKRKAVLATNHDGSTYLYFKVVNKDASLPMIDDGTTYGNHGRIGPGESLQIPLGPNCDLALVRMAGTGNVTVVEVL